MSRALVTMPFKNDTLCPLLYLSHLAIFQQLVYILSFRRRLYQREYLHRINFEYLFAIFLKYCCSPFEPFQQHG